ncbi:MAG: stage III sporulation protein AE, partial [Oscillospiraceae bacterium]|nr:stage III sporulation protein AE [Oscillospiraceae bacterium]
VLAAAGAARGTVGALGVFAILSAFLVPLLRIGAQFVLYKLAAFAAGLVGTKALSDFLARLGDAFALVFAMTAACALVLLASMLTAVAVTAG